MKKTNEIEGKKQVADWLKEWLEVYEKAKIKLTTYCKYRELITSHLCPYFKNMLLENLEVGDIFRFTNYLLESGNKITGKGLSVNSVNVVLRILLSSLKCAYDVELIRIDIGRQTKPLKLVEEKVEAFRLTEQRKIEEYILNTDKQKFVGVLVCLYTGLRIGEVVALKWRNVNLNKGIISIKETTSRINTPTGYISYTGLPKTISSMREIPLPRCLLEILRELKKQSSCEFVVTNRVDGKIDVRSMQYIFNRLLKKLHIRELSFHSLRHTFATRAIESGMDVKTLAEVMGHSNPMITLKIYVQTQDKYKRKMMNKLNFLVQQDYAK